MASILDPAPTREAMGGQSWVRWFNQIYSVVQNMLTGGSFTSPTLTDPTITGTATLASASVFLPSVNVALGNNWANVWTPALTGSGSMTVSLTNRLESAYFRVGALTFVKLYLQLSLGGVASNTLTLPLPSTNNGQNSLLNAWVSPVNSTSWVPAFCYAGQGVNTLFVLPQQYVNYSLGTLYLIVSGFYQS